MNPDDDNYIEPEEDEEPDLLVCPECGSTQWKRWQRGRFNQTLRLDTYRRWSDETEDTDMDIDEEDTWECCQCGHTACPEEDEAITEWLNGN